MKILIATDGSEFSRNAVEEGCNIISTKNQTDIKIISGVERVRPISAEPFGASNEYYAQVEADLRKKAREAVAAAEKIINDNLKDENIFVSTEVFTGNVKQGIVDEGKNFEADVIIVGSHGYGFLERVLLGSISSYVLHHAPCSVLVVRKKASNSANN
jgi:nucleotide-binding universal stress UspA family protein